MKCPVCGGAPRPVFEAHGYEITECKACGHRYCDFQPPTDHVPAVYNDHYFNGGGAGYADYLAYNPFLTAHGERYSAILEGYTQPGTMLDVGSAAGFILKGFKNKGWTVTGVEPNERMAAHAREQLGLPVTSTTLETLQSDRSFRLVTMIQVIAHFYELRKALQTAADITEPGGFWLIETWNKDSWVARLFGRHWHEYSPPSVLNWFSPKTLNLLAGQYGFNPVAVGRPAKWLYGSHAKSLLQYKFEGTRLGESGVKLLKFIPDRFAVPYPAYDLFWSLFRKAA